MNKSKLSKIKLVIVDVDGTLTGGEIILDNHEGEYKSFNIKDGLRIAQAVKTGLKIAFITGRSPKIAKRRAKELGVNEVYQDVFGKARIYERLKKKYQLLDEEVMAVGDDLNDLGLLKKAGVKVAVANAAKEVQNSADLVTAKKGGEGAVGEIIEMILKSQGKWQKIINSYLK